MVRLIFSKKYLDTPIKKCDEPYQTSGYVIRVLCRFGRTAGMQFIVKHCLHVVGQQLGRFQYGSPMIQIILLMLLIMLRSYWEYLCI